MSSWINPKPHRTINQDADDVATIIHNFDPEFPEAKHELIRCFSRYFARRDPFGFNRTKFFATCIRRKVK